MNYYQYKRRAPRSRATDFIKPFLVIIIFIAIIVAGWKLIGGGFGGNDETLSSEKIYLDIETGSAKAMTSGSNEWKSVPSSIYLYEGEKLRTQSDGRVSLRLFEKDTVRLDKSTEVEFASLSRDAVGTSAGIKLAEGKLWVEVNGDASDRSEVDIDTGLLKLSSTGGTFAITYPGMLYVVDGSVKADVYYDGSIVKSSTIGVGQELILDESIAADLSEDIQKEVIFALDDAFKSSNWYRWNQQQGTAGSNMMEDVTSSDEEAATDNTADEVVTEDTSDTADETDTEQVIDENDKEPPTQPEINEPGNNDDTITLDTTAVDIKGTVSSDTEAVMVNDYRLTKYAPGSGTFRYTASIDFGNLEVGDNEFKVIAMDKNNNESEAAIITLTLPQDVYDEAKPDEEDATDNTTASESTDNTPEATSSGGVTITGPNGGENLTTSETAFGITGTVPEGTVKVVVNGYQLQGFAEGDTTFKYNAKSTLGTLQIGELNTYTVKAYDADDALLGQASMTIDVESGATETSGGGAPVITMPSSSATYDTTLDQIVLGGTVGKWITRVKIDGANLDDYIPGSEEWKKTITLSPGENSIEVCAEQEGETQGCSSITINYNN